MTSPDVKTQTCQIKILLPRGTRVLVEKGDLVTSDQLLAASKEVVEEFNLTKILRVKPQDISHYLLVSPGAEIKEGEVIAQKKSLLQKVIFKSPVTGVFAELLPEGFLKIKTSENLEVRAPVNGKVQEIKNEDYLSLEFEALVLLGEKGEGPEKWGEISLFESKEAVGLADLPSNPSGKIFLVQGEITSGFVHKAEALGAVGIVGHFDGKGVQTSDLSLLILDGQEGRLSEELWEILSKYKGRKALISGGEKALKIPVN